MTIYHVTGCSLPRIKSNVSSEFRVHLGVLWSVATLDVEEGLATRDYIAHSEMVDVNMTSISETIIPEGKSSKFIIEGVADCASALKLVLF